MTASKPRLCVDIDNVIAQTDRVMREIIREYTGGRVKWIAPINRPIAIMWIGG
jgi:hypothetical protein